MSSAKSHCQSNTSGIPPGSIPRLKLFNSFVNRIECTLTLMAVANTLESRTVILSKVDKLEKGADRNLMKFNPGKCRALHLAWQNPTHNYRPGRSWLKSIFKET